MYLEEFIIKIKKMGYAIKLDTNGSAPMILKDLLKTNLVDYVAMDIKTILELNDYERICGIKDPKLLMNIKESIEILKNSGINFQLRTTVVPRFHSMEMIDKLQKEFSYCNYQVQEYRETIAIAQS